MNSLLKSLMSSVIITGNPVKESKATTKEDTTRKRVSKTPDNDADVRIHYNGKVYPNAAFASKWGLEYENKNSNKVSNGVDLFKAFDWINYQGNTQPLLLGYVIRQDQPKVELFAGIRYDADGNPINSVMDQGSILSAETLNMIAEGLGSIESDGGSTSPWENLLVQLAPEGQNEARYVDLKFEETEDLFKMQDGKYFIPKAVNKGEKKGTMTTVKRENINIMLVTVFDGITQEEIQEEENKNDWSPSEEYANGTLGRTQEDTDGEEVPTSEVETPEFDDLLNVHTQFENKEVEELVGE